MTCREKLKIERGDEGFYMTVDPYKSPMPRGCPSDYGYLDKPPICDGGDCALTCDQCWDRKIPEVEIKTEPTTIEESENHVSEFFEKLLGPTIKDSGNRREFETGAVRDICEGKGRCDLMPLEIVQKLIARYSGNDKLLNQSAVIHEIHIFQYSGMVEHLFSALHAFSLVDSVKATWPDVYTMLLDVAKHFEAGAKKYGEYNWQKGIPTHCYIDSAVRHYLKFCRGDKDEPHDRAFVWNIMCCIWTCGSKPELNDYPRKEEKDEPAKTQIN
jgi:hypothetical protein